MYQKLTVLGRVIRDPELRYTPNTNTPVTELTVAVDDSYKKEDKSEFFDFTVWGKTAEIVAEYATKGRVVLIEGRVNKESWETSEGEKRSNWRFTAERVKFVGGGSRQEPAAAQPAAPTEPAADSDDIPF